ncbi:unnamed protein product [Protopolystoma xenopodis]|uniref:Uncharacterized protein n=1 Tax=Protopolystoma xenopodis TaxID=117903 RepID=A0A3S5AZL7_9PLAT|nr:unnamed protein product [Protopolystoma xenopodis]
MDSDYANCCLPLARDGYLSLFSAVIGSLVSFPVAFALISCFGRRWAITICFFCTSLLLFVEARSTIITIHHTPTRQNLILYNEQ